MEQGCGPGLDRARSCRADHSPIEIIEALELAGTQVARQFEGDDLDATGLGVSWAGADPAPKWLDVAREFTEYWTHRQQIRHATGRDTDPEPNALSTVLDAFMRALPHTLRDTPAPAGTQLQVVIDEPAVGTWTVTATADRWSLAEAPSGRPTASVRLDPETAWRLCTRGIDPGTALARARISGDRQIAAQLAAEYGYVNRVLPEGELDDFVDAFARRIAGFDKAAISGTKEFVDAASRVRSVGARTASGHAPLVVDERGLPCGGRPQQTAARIRGGGHRRQPAGLQTVCRRIQPGQSECGAVGRTGGEHGRLG